MIIGIIGAFDEEIEKFIEVFQLRKEEDTIWDIYLGDFQEKHLVCEYYGGTLDMLVQVDNRIYLVDFKTSNHFNYKYHLQTAAYRRILYTKYNINVDGIIILKLSKDKVYFEEQVLDFTRYDHVEYINNCERMFLSLVYAWYNRYIVENQYKKIYWYIIVYYNNEYTNEKRKEVLYDENSICRNNASKNVSRV